MTTDQRPDLAGRTVGFIGLGLMGQPMATNLHKAGAKLLVPQRSASAVAELAADQIEVLGTPAEITRAADLVILMLPNAKAVESVCAGPDGVIEGAGPKKTLLDMGTTDAKTTAATAEQLQKTGAAFVDAPVTGGRVGALNGNLTIFVGSDSSDIYTEVAPVLAVMGTNITHVGPVGSGQAAKVVNQLINFSTQAAVAEGIALARRAGLDLNDLIPSLAGGAADSFVLQVLGPRMAAEDWSVTAHMQLAVKDMDIVLDSAREHGLDLELAELVRAQWAAASEKLGADHDIAEFVRFVDSKFSGGGWRGASGAIGSGTPSRHSKSDA